MAPDWRARRVRARRKQSGRGEIMCTYLQGGR